jgi:hypothetical protein
MPEMRKPSGKGRSVKKDKLRPALPLGYGLFKYFIFLPKRKDFFFKFGKVHFWVNALIHMPLLELQYVIKEDFFPYMAGNAARAQTDCIRAVIQGLNRLTIQG